MNSSSREGLMTATKAESALARGLITFRGTDSAIAQMYTMLKLTDEVVVRNLGISLPTAASNERPQAHHF